MGPFRRSTQPDKAYPDLIGHILDLAQMTVHFVAGLVDGLDRGTGQLQLPTRFKRHIRAVLFQPDQFAALRHRGPVVAVAQPLQHHPDRPFTFVGQRLVGVFAIAKLFVLCTDAPLIFGLASVRQIFGQLFVTLNGAAAGLWNGHV